MPQQLWQPTAQQIADANITAFRLAIESEQKVDLPDYTALYQWSISQPELFWKKVWEFCGVVSSVQGTTVLTNGDKMPGAKWFPEAQLNFAENLLQKAGAEPAIIFRAEDSVARQLSWDLLRQQVASVAEFLRGQGVAGDRVAGFMPNMPETVVAMLATASIGAVWSSSSPDFGVRGVVDRFGQIEPKVLFTATGYFYNGKFHDSLAKTEEFLRLIPSVQRVVVIPFSDPYETLPLELPNSISFQQVLASAADAELSFTQLPFDHPLYVMYSSGTTGVPKCIVHSLSLIHI